MLNSLSKDGADISQENERVQAVVSKLLNRKPSFEMDRKDGASVETTETEEESSVVILDGEEEEARIECGDVLSSPELFAELVQRVIAALKNNEIRGDEQSIAIQIRACQTLMDGNTSFREAKHRTLRSEVLQKVARGSKINPENILKELVERMMN